MANFGSLTLFKNDGSLGPIYALKEQEKCTIGSKVTNSIRLQSNDFNLKDVHCIVEVHQNGVATLVNKAPLHPAQINGENICRYRCLRSGDVISILNKRFLYENENLSPNLIRETEKQVKHVFLLKSTKLGRKSLHPAKQLKKRVSVTPKPKKTLPIVSRKNRSSSLSGFVGNYISSRRTNNPFSPLMPSKRISTPQIEKGMRVYSPTSSSKPSTSTNRHETRSKMQLFHESSDDEGEPGRELKTPVTENVDENSFTTPQNNTSLVLVESPIEEATPVRSKRSMVKNLSIQRLTKNDDSIIVLGTPNSKTPKSALKAGSKVKTPKSALKKSKLMTEILGTEVCTSTPAKRKSVVIVEDTIDQDISVMSDFTEESIYNSSIANLSAVEVSPQKRVTRHSNSNISLPRKSLNASELEHAGLKSTNKSYKINFIENSRKPSTRQSMISVSTKPLNKSRKSMPSMHLLPEVKPSRRSTKVSKVSFMESSEDSSEKPVSPLVNWNVNLENATGDNAKTPKNTVNPLTKSSMKQKRSSVKTIPHISPLGTPVLRETSRLSLKKSSLLIGDTSNTDTDLTSELSSSESERRGRKRGRGSDISMLPAKRFHYKSSTTFEEDESNSSNGFKSPNLLVKRAMTEPKMKKKMTPRRSLPSSNLFGKDESVEDDCGDTTVESVDTSSFIYLSGERSTRSSSVNLASIDAEDEPLAVDLPLRRRSRVQNEPKNDLSSPRGVKQLMKTPKPHKEPLNDLSSPKGVKKLMKTPKQQKGPLNDLTSPKGIKKLLKTPKEQKGPLNDLSSPKGIKRLLRTPKPQSEPLNDLSSPKGVKKLLKTPKVQKGPLNDLSSPRGVKQLLKTPKPVQKEPKNDLSSPRGVKQLLKTPKPLSKEPKNDLSSPRGVKQLLKTPKPPQKEPKNDLSSPRGVKQLLKTPKPPQKEPKNDLSSPRGVKQLLKTPKPPQKEPKNDLSSPRGVKQLLKTPKPLQKEPKNDLSSPRGVKQLLKTPKAPQKEPENDLSSPRGVKQLMKTPKQQNEPLNDLTSPYGVKRLLRSPKPAQREPENDLTNPYGMKRLLRTPKIQKEPKNDLSNPLGVKKLMSTPKPNIEPKNDLTNPFGVKLLYENEPKNDLSDVDGVFDLFKDASNLRTYSRKSRLSNPPSPVKSCQDIIVYDVSPDVKKWVEDQNNDCKVSQESTEILDSQVVSTPGNQKNEKGIITSANRKHRQVEEFENCSTPTVPIRKSVRKSNRNIEGQDEEQQPSDIPKRNNKSMEIKVSVNDTETETDIKIDVNNKSRIDNETASLATPLINSPDLKRKSKTPGKVTPLITVSDYTDRTEESLELATPTSKTLDLKKTKGSTSRKNKSSTGINEDTPNPQSNSERHTETAESSELITPKINVESKRKSKGSISKNNKSFEAIITEVGDDIDHIETKTGGKEDINKHDVDFEGPSKTEKKETINIVKSTRARKALTGLIDDPVPVPKKRARRNTPENNIESVTPNTGEPNDLIDSDYEGKLDVNDKKVKNLGVENKILSDRSNEENQIEVVKKIEDEVKTSILTKRNKKHEIGEDPEELSKSLKSTRRGKLAEEIKENLSDLCNMYDNKKQKQVKFEGSPDKQNSEIVLDSKPGRGRPKKVTNKSATSSRRRGVGNNEEDEGTATNDESKNSESELETTENKKTKTSVRRKVTQRKNTKKDDAAVIDNEKLSTDNTNNVDDDKIETKQMKTTRRKAVKSDMKEKEKEDDVKKFESDLEVVETNKTSTRKRTARKKNVRDDDVDTEKDVDDMRKSESEPVDVVLTGTRKTSRRKPAKSEDDNSIAQEETNEIRKTSRRKAAQVKSIKITEETSKDEDDTRNPECEIESTGTRKMTSRRKAAQKKGTDDKTQEKELSTSRNEDDVHLPETKPKASRRKAPQKRKLAEEEMPEIKDESLVESTETKQSKTGRRKVPLRQKAKETEPVMEEPINLKPSRRKKTNDVEETLGSEDLAEQKDTDSEKRSKKTQEAPVLEQDVVSPKDTDSETSKKKGVSKRTANKQNSEDLGTPKVNKGKKCVDTDEVTKQSTFTDILDPPKVTKPKRKQIKSIDDIQKEALDAVVMPAPAKKSKLIKKTIEASPDITGIRRSARTRK